jgi:pimeloyl-ACP methyl ester carboxylesterase
MKEKLEEAKRRGDAGEQIRLSGLLAQMHERAQSGFEEIKEELLRESNVLEQRGKLPSGKISNLRINQIFTRVDQIDESLFKIADVGQTRKLEKERQKLLAEVLNAMFSEPERGHTWSPFLKITWRGMLATIAAKHHRINQEIPLWLRKRIDVPVAIVGAEGDVVFPPEELERGIDDAEHYLRRSLRESRVEKAYEEGKFFSNSPLILRARVSDWGHKAPGLEPIRFGEIIADLASKMHSEVASGQGMVNLRY